MTVALVLCFMAAPSFAQSALELYRRSSMEHQLSQFADSLSAAMQSEREGMYGNMTDDEFDALLEVVPRAFSETSMERGIVSAIDNQLTDSQIEEVLAWLNSSTGQAIIAVQESASGPSAVPQLREYRAAGEIDRLSQDRLHLIDEYMAAAGTLEQYADLFVGIRLGMVAGRLATVPMDPRAFEERLLEIENQLESALPTVKGQLTQRARVNVAFTYRNATDDQLRAYKEFLSSSIGKEYGEVVTATLQSVLVEAAERLGRLLAEELDTTMPTS